MFRTYGSLEIHAFVQSLQVRQHRTNTWWVVFNPRFGCIGPGKKNLQYWKRKREKDHLRINCEEGHKRRHAAKAVKDLLMGKEDAKKRHKSGKVSVKDSARVKQTRKATTCGWCHQPFHNRTACIMPPLEVVSPKTNLLYWSSDIAAATRKPRGKIFVADLIDWSA